jgi:hypothetical protein
MGEAFLSGRMGTLTFRRKSETVEAQPKAGGSPALRGRGVSLPWVYGQATC